MNLHNQQYDTATIIEGEGGVVLRTEIVTHVRLSCARGWFYEQWMRNSARNEVQPAKFESAWSEQAEDPAPTAAETPAQPSPATKNIVDNQWN